MQKPLGHYMLAPTIVMAATSCWLPLAQAGPFLEASVGQGDISEWLVDDRSQVSRASVGYMWGDFGVEIGRFEGSNFTSTKALGPQAPIIVSNVDISGLLLGARFKKALSERWFTFARSGALHWSVDPFVALCDPECTPGSDSPSRSGTDFYAGVGLGFSLNTRLSLTIAYDLYRTDMVSGATAHDPDTGQQVGGIVDLDADVRSTTLGIELRF